MIFNISLRVGLRLIFFSRLLIIIIKEIGERSERERDWRERERSEREREIGERDWRERERDMNDDIVISSFLDFLKRGSLDQLI